MGVDLNKAKAKAAEEAAKQEARTRGFQSVTYWKPGQGKNKIRVMPPWTDDETNPNANQFWREVFVHFSVGDNESVFACPAKTTAGPGGACVLCEEVQRLRATRDPADASVAKDMNGKQRLYSNIVDLADPVYTAKDIKEWTENEFNEGKDCPFDVGDTKIQVFGYGPMIFKQLLDILTENIDFTDLESGYDISITRSGKDRNTEYQVTLVPPAKPFEVIGRDLEEAIPDLDALLPFQDAANMRAALTGEPPPPAPQMAGRASESRALPSAAPEPPPPPPKAATVQEAVQDADIVEDDDEEPPECFEDPDIHNEKDAECCGGVKDIDGERMEFDPCPFFDACHKAVTKALEPPPPPPKKRRGRPKGSKNKPKTNTNAPSAAVISDDVDALEAEMQKVIN